MKPDSAFDPAKAAKKLLREARSGALATLMVQGSAQGGDPYCSLVNVATDHAGAPLLLLSRLALHTKNILADARASLMLDERKEGDPLEGARIMLMGRAVADESASSRARYLAFHRDAAQFVDFKDFGFYRFEITRVHLVAGFGRIVDLSAAQILTNVNGAQDLVDAETDAVAHMNDDHREALRLYATKLLGAPPGDWRCVGIDPDGLDMQNGRTGLRLDFPQRVTAPGPLRAVLKQLAEAARAK